MFEFGDKSKFKLFGEVADEIFNRDTHLSHGVALADGDAVVFKRIEVHGDAIGCADFVLTAVSLADRRGRVEVASEVLGKFDIQFFRFFVELFLQGEHCNLDRCDCVMQVEHDAGVVFADLLFFVCVAKECKEHSVCAERRLDDVRHVFLVGDGVDITQIFAACLDVLVKVVVGAVCNAPEFAPTEREFVFEVGGCFGVETKLFLVVVAQFEFFVVHAEIEKPLMAEVLPIVEPFKVGAGFAEKFKFHLLEFADTEDEVAGGDFVAETLADLTDAERHFLSRRALHVLEVDEDALCGFGAQIDGGSGVFRHADERLEHKVEFSHAREVAVAAHGAGNLVLVHVLFHLLVRPTCDVFFDAVLVHIVFDKIVCAVTGFAAFAVHKGIGETADMSACLPSGRVHNDCAVKSHVVGIFDDEFLPPSLLDVVFHLHAERAVVPRV